MRDASGGLHDTGRSMPDAEPLRRLGGGRWQTRDGRFTIEPQAGTWAVVDAEQTDELGLPLVRGPYRSLGDARAAIAAAVESGAAESPLAARLMEAQGSGRTESGRRRSGSGRQRAEPGRRSSGASRTRGERTSAGRATPTGPTGPTEPDWLLDLEPRGRTAARRLIRKLEAAGVEDAASIARRDLVDGEPAVARAALWRAISSAASDADGGARTDALVDLLASGRDDELGVSWRLVDGDGRPIGRLARRSGRG